MAIDERTSNALGVPIPLWVINQLDKRSKELSVQNIGDSSKINDNVKFRGNRSAWVRMVSSVDLLNPKEAAAKIPNKAFDYFKNTLGLNIQDQTDLAKLFVLQGGVSKYESTGPTQFSYNLRNGFKEAYNVTGTEREINKYGYRPMPGITSARVQTTGKLGSIKSAEIQIKVWDKEQLDIIDALYFKLGYSVLLEWGHTFYYDSEKGDLRDTESFSINPFEKGLTKEDIFNKISNNVRESQGNYDAMLGIVTNFNFTYNQEGGYDCTIKMISLGVLISNMKMNNPRVLPDIQDYVVKKLYNRLTEIQKQKLLKDTQALENQKLKDNKRSAYPPCVRDLGDIANPPADLYGKKGLGKEAINAGVNQVTYYFYPDGRYQTTGYGGQGTYECRNNRLYIDGKPTDPKNYTYEEVLSAYKQKITRSVQGSRGGKASFLDDVIGINYLALDKFKTLMPQEVDDYDVKVKLDIPKLSQLADAFDQKDPIQLLVNADKLLKVNEDGVLVPIKEGDQINYTDNLGIFLDSKLKGGNLDAATTGVRISGQALNFLQSVANFLEGSPTVSPYSATLYYKTKTLNYGQIRLIYSNASEYLNDDSLKKAKVNNLQRIDTSEKDVQDIIRNTISSNQIEWKVTKFYSGVFELVYTINIPTSIDNYVQDVIGSQGAYIKAGKKQVNYKLELKLLTTDIDLISEIKVAPNSNLISPKTLESEQQDQNTEEAPNTETTPPITVSDIQKSETEKYRSAFEVMVRTLQLYSLDQSVQSGIETDHVIKTTYLLDPSIYDELTKELFSSGLFSKLLGPDASVGKNSQNKNDQSKRSDLIYYVTNASKNINNILNSDAAQLCAQYDAAMVEGKGAIKDKELMIKVRALFGFHFALLGNQTTATQLLSKKCFVDYGILMSTYTVPYEFESGIFEGTQLNHPVYLPLGLVIMILNHICTIYDKESPLVYFDFNHKTNLCLSNAKHLSTNPYEIIIPFQGKNSDFASILEPSTLAEAKGNQSGNKVLAIKPTKEKTEGDESGATPIFTPYNPQEGPEAVKDRISGGLLPFKFTDGLEDTYRGRTMNILVSCDYLLKTVSTFTKNNGSGDVYAREFIEQILFDANKYMGDVNIFRLAYDDKGNVAHVVDDQMTPNLEGQYPVANESIKDPKNRSKLPLFGIGSIARNLEIRTEVSSKLSNMIAISANSNYEDQSSLSKSAESFGFYNLSYMDRYIPTRTEFTSSLTLPTDTMIRSAIQFNESIKSFYGSAKPAFTAVSHATNYYIQRMSKIKTSEVGTRAAAMIPVSLNFSIDGMSGFGMGQSFTIDPEFLPYTYDLSSTNPFGEQERDRTVAFVMIGLDHIIEGNQWISNVRSNMIFAKKAQDFTSGVEKLRTLERPEGLLVNQTDLTTYNGVAVATKKLNFTYEQIKNAIKKKGYAWYDSDYKLNIIGVRNSSTNNLVTDKFDDVLVLAYKDGTEIKFYQWAITTDPGAYYNVNFFPGTTSTGRMVPGQYINAYSIGLHRDKYEALVEVGAIKAFRDDNKNDVFDETNIQQGNFNMNIHKALASDTGVRGEINDSSAGCQVFASSQDFSGFMSIVKNSKNKLNNNFFTYTLLTSQDIS